jgi:hypothetical protein
METTTARGLGSWAITDLDGRIEAASSGARALLGSERLSRGDSLLLLFASHERAVLFDIEVAMTGRPVERVLQLRPLAVQPIRVRYRISCLAATNRAGLFWELDVAPAAGLPH